MDKRTYLRPKTFLVEIEVQCPLADSQFNVSVYNPSDEVNAKDALSRDNISCWDE